MSAVDKYACRYHSYIACIDLEVRNCKDCAVNTVMILGVCLNNFAIPCKMNYLCFYCKREKKNIVFKRMKSE